MINTKQNQNKLQSLSWTLHSEAQPLQQQEIRKKEDKAEEEN